MPYNEKRKRNNITINTEPSICTAFSQRSRQINSRFKNTRTINNIYLDGDELRLGLDGQCFQELVGSFAPLVTHYPVLVSMHL